MLAKMAQLIVEVQENNETIAELTNKVEELEAEVEDIGDIVAVGQCGENVFYALYSNGKLILKGTGDTYDYTWSLDGDSYESPFTDNQDIKKVIVSNGITKLGDYLFRFCDELETVSLPNSVATIGEMTFYVHSDDRIPPRTSHGLTDISFTKSEKRNMIPESRQEQSTGGYDHERSKKDSSRQDRRRRN